MENELYTVDEQPAHFGMAGAAAAAGAGCERFHYLIYKIDSC